MFRDGLILQYLDETHSCSVCYISKQRALIKKALGFSLTLSFVYIYLYLVIPARSFTLTQNRVLNSKEFIGIIPERPRSDIMFKNKCVQSAPIAASLPFLEKRNAYD